MSSNVTYVSEAIVFEGLFANHGSKICAILFSIFTSPINIVMAYGVIWFETYGTGNKRTLVNKMGRKNILIKKKKKNWKNLFLQVPVHNCRIKRSYTLLGFLNTDFVTFS